MLIGPGLMMAGANIGGGEWLFGPVVTAQYGGRIMWLATLSIALQAFYNLAVMRYALYCGEPIFVGFFRTAPGPVFWTVFYFLADLGGLWPYLSSNAAVPLATVLLGRLPTAADDALTRGLSYAIFLACFVPLIFGGKIYNALEKVMVVKLVLVLAYLGFTAVALVSWQTWAEIISGLFRFGALPEGHFDWAVLAAFAAVAGAGGLTNSYFSSYARDKGWGMGALVAPFPARSGVAPSSFPTPAWFSIPRVLRWSAGAAGCVISAAISSPCGSPVASPAWPCPRCSRWSSSAARRWKGTLLRP